MHFLLHDIAVAIIAATVIGLLAHRLRQPIILGYLVAGAIVGPQLGFSFVNVADNIEIISEIGLILLLFIIGLEMNVAQILAAGRQLLVAGFGQFPVCVALGLAIFYMAGYGVSAHNCDALYLAILCGLSSTAIVVKLLYDKMELDTLPGRLSVGILVIQDIYAILILAFQPNFANPTVGPMLRAVLLAAVLLLFGFLLSRYVLARVFMLIRAAPEMVVAVSIAWCASVATIAAWAGLSKEMGALIAGLSISAFPYSVHVTAKTLPLRDFFLTLFFVSLGMKITAPSRDILLPLLGIVAFVILSRFLSIYPLLKLAGSGPRAAFITTLNLAQISEFSLVIAAIGVQYGHIAERTVTVTIYAMSVTAVLSSYAIRYSHPLYKLFELVSTRWFGRRSSEPDIQPPHGHGPKIVVLGYHRAAHALVQSLRQHNTALLHDLLVVDFNREVVNGLAARGVQALFGDISSLSTLEHAHANEARVIACTIPDMLLKGTDNAGITRLCRQLAPNAQIITTADDAAHRDRLLAQGASAVILPYELTAHHVANLIQQAVMPLPAHENPPDPSQPATQRV